MSQRFVRLPDFLTCSITILLLIPVLLIGAVRTQEWIFRYRAEHLLSETQSFEPGHTTFQQVSSVFERWHRYSRPSGTTCSNQNCDFVTAISIPLMRHGNSKI